MAAETEFWRSHRGCAAVLHFCGLGYSRPDGQTSDHWADVEKLAWDPDFYGYVRDAFAPVGLMIDAWAEEYPPGATQRVSRRRDQRPVRGLAGDGAAAAVPRRQNGVREERALPGPGVGQGEADVCVGIPHLPVRTGSRPLCSSPAPRSSAACATSAFPARPNCGPREVSATGRPVKASSSIALAGATSPAAAVDGRLDTRWSSAFSDPQWIAVDLQKVERISRVVLAWETAYARAYSINVPLDGKTWKEVYRTQDGKGETEEIRFPPADARWVRMTGTRRATPYGYSLWELSVYNN